MHWFVEKVQSFYSLELQPRCQPFHTCEFANRTFEGTLNFLLSLIEYGGVCFWGNAPPVVDVRSGFILSTSGTTGVPKEALYSFDVFLEKFRDASHKPIKTIMVMGVDHIGGMDIFFSIVARGGSLIFPQQVTPTQICSLIEEHKIEFISLSPTFLNLILLSGVHRQFDLSSLKTVNFGAEVMPSALLEKLTHNFPNTEFRQTFGTTESGTMFVERHQTNPLWIKIPDSKVIDSKLYVRSKFGMSGYLQGDVVKDEDGYFPTGDVVEQHGDYIRILGREIDHVNVGGHKVSPTKVEEILLGIPGVQDARVYGERHLIMGQILVAEIVSDCDKDHIRNYLKGKVDKHEIPSKIKLMSQIPYSQRFKKVRTNQP